MPRFSIYSGSLLVGWSELEAGDPPMGVASGKFLPAAGYATIQAFVVSAAGVVKPELRLSVRRGQEEIQSRAGVFIIDFSPELGPEDMEISILGIVQPPYESLFPEHVAAYARGFQKEG